MKLIFFFTNVLLMFFITPMFFITNVFFITLITLRSERTGGGAKLAQPLTIMFGERILYCNGPSSHGLLAPDLVLVNPYPPRQILPAFRRRQQGWRTLATGALVYVG